MQAAPVLIVMPLFNAQPYVEAAVGSILSQTFGDFHFLVIDDGSTDGGPELVRQIGDPRLQLWHQANAGPGATMNRAISYAHETGYRFVARMDADDISLPERIEKQIRLLSRAGESVAACSANCLYFVDDVERITGTSTVPRSPALVRWEIQNGLRGLIQGALLARTEALVAIGSYRPQFVLAEDTDLFMRLSERYALRNHPDFLYKIRLRPGSLSVHNAEINVTYTMYALDCLEHRRQGRAERTYEAFCREMGAIYRFRVWRERWLLRVWREGIRGGDFALLLAAGLIDPRRVASRILRRLERTWASGLR